MRRAGGENGEKCLPAPSARTRLGIARRQPRYRLVFGLSLDVVAWAIRADLGDPAARTYGRRGRMRRWGRPRSGRRPPPTAPPGGTCGEAGQSPPVLRLDDHARRRALPVRHRFGLVGRSPPALAPLPPLPNENLDPDYTGGDLRIEACSDDPWSPSTRPNLARLGMGVVKHDWMELGSGRTSTTTTSQGPPQPGRSPGRHRNIKAEQTRLMDDYVWAGPETDERWLRGGSYLVARKIRIFVENWDRDYLQDQENVRPRQRVRRPAHRRNKIHHPGLHRTDSAGSRSSPAMPTSGWPASSTTGTGILRRGNSFTDGIDPQTGALLGGLFVIASEEPRPVHQAPERSGRRRPQPVHPSHRKRRLRLPPGIDPGQRWGDGILHLPGRWWPAWPRPC